MTIQRRPAALAALAGVGLAVLCKHIYDLFNGLAVIPNLMLQIGLTPSADWLEALQFITLAATAFASGRMLQRTLQWKPAGLALACAMPWVGVQVWALADFWTSHGDLFIGRSRLETLAFMGPPLLALLAVPTGLWLATWGRP